jgi:hypothetical protein
MGLGVAVVTAAAAVALMAPTAQAEIGGVSLLPNNAPGSDPHVIPCTPPNGASGFCMYTSQDMGEEYRYDGNWYPMRLTKVYFSTDGYNWTEAGSTESGSGQKYVFREPMVDALSPYNRPCSTSGDINKPYTPSGETAGNCRPYHVWAPAAIKDGNTYYLFVPFATSYSNTDPDGGGPLLPPIRQGQRITVMSSSSPFGPFSHLGDFGNPAIIPYQSGVNGGEMYDPHPFIDSNGQRWLVYADGEAAECGGYRIGRMNAGWETWATAPTAITLSGATTELGTCTNTQGVTVQRPYLEGPSIYWSRLSGTYKWTLIFPAKPSITPPGCSNSQSVIGWATSTTSSPAGPYQYQGVAICGGTEWTNQASLAVNGQGKTFIYFHDGKASPKMRYVYGECLYFGAGHVGRVYRQQPSASNGFKDCTETTQTTYQGLWSEDPQYPSLPEIVSVASGTGDVTANRWEVGPWERFQFSGSGSSLSIKALSNGKFLCSTSSSVALKPSCTSANDPGAKFTLENADSNGHFWLKSNHNNLYVSIGSNGKLLISGTGTSYAAKFARLSTGNAF